MIALWSFWSKPALNFGHAPWASPLHHLLSWVLSVETARKHFPETELVTDTPGAHMLVDGIGLTFSRVSVLLDAISGVDPRWWALGKLHAYRSQERPFVHIDSDVYLWKGLPEACAGAPVITQNPEDFILGDSWYHPEKFNTIRDAGGWVPDELQWFMALGLRQKAECCGIMGGANTGFIRYYADNAIRLVTHPVNAVVWPEIGIDNILVEQYFLSAAFEYHRSSPDNPFGALDMAYIFGSSQEAFTPDAARQAGYTHLIGGAKRNPELLKRLERRVERDYPLQYDRCLNFVRQLQR